MNNTPITLITTGGTIGSSTSESSVSVNNGQQNLERQIRGICDANAWGLNIVAAFNKNSEDLIPGDWLRLIGHIEKAAASGCENIVITHGTDTMAYTATAIALCCAHLPARIVLTGSCYTLDHPKSDVCINILGALNTATQAQLPQGSYVSFCDPVGEVRVIHALDIKPMHFDELAFDGCFKQRQGKFESPQNCFELSSQPRSTQLLDTAFRPAQIEAELLEKACSRLFQLHCYPGMDALQLCSGLQADSVVIVSLYHSGTGPSLAGQSGLLEAIEQRRDLTFILSTFPSPYIDKPYASSLTLVNAGAHLIKDIQPHQLYVLFALGMASAMPIPEIIKLTEAYKI